jgi:prepilin-type N-terminal cleavage/methylation domain-containing protein
MDRRAFSLPELLVVTALVALVTAVGVPALLHVVDRRLVDSAAQQLVLAHREARITSATTRQTALLLMSADLLELRLTRGGPDTVLAWSRPGPRHYGVAVTGNPRTARFIPSGYTIGVSNASYTFTRGAATRKVVISRLGRVRVE